VGQDRVEESFHIYQGEFAIFTKYPITGLITSQTNEWLHTFTDDLQIHHYKMRLLQTATELGSVLIQVIQT